MVKLGPTLFYVGLVVAVAGFLGDKAESLPWALRFLAPSYVRASAGLETLQSKGSLAPDETGFPELEQIFRREAEAKGVGAQLYFQQVRRFERKTAMIAFGEGRAGEVVPVEVHLSTRKVDWDMAGLRERTEGLKRSSLLRFSLMVFLIGLGATVVGRIVESHDKRPNTAVEPSKPEVQQ